jgi:hypothetical protein
MLSSGSFVNQFSDQSAYKAELGGVSLPSAFAVCGSSSLNATLQESNCLDCDESDSSSKTGGPANINIMSRDTRRFPDVILASVIFAAAVFTIFN